MSRPGSGAAPLPGAGAGADAARAAVVALDRPLPRPYTYAVPDELRGVLRVGHRVHVPLGPGEARGVVIELLAEAPTDLKLRPVREVLDPLPLLGEDLRQLAGWITHHYVGHLGEVLDAMAPGGARDLRPVPRYRLLGPLDLALERVGNRARGQRELLEVLARYPRGILREALLRERPKCGPVLRSLVAGGHVEVGLESRSPGTTPETDPTEGFPALSDEQACCYEAIRADVEDRVARTHLVHGITGSGKTEIYLALIRDVVDRGRGAIFLLPEIALTVPVMDLLRARFGSRVALLHSGLAPRERYREWIAIARGDRPVVVGARSAIFAPLPELGLVVIDEEPESSYRQDERPVYHAREVAIERARWHRAPVVLGSATPSLETYHRAVGGTYGYHRLALRWGGRALPEVALVDMGREFSEKRNTSIFSMDLRSQLHRVLGEGGQALLFLNRRGHSTYLFCRSCGHVERCVACSLAMNYHQDRDRVICHLCGHQAVPPRDCPRCQSPAFRYLGGGTQKVEEAFRLNFPDVPAERMDSDTTTARGSHARILDRYRRGLTRVLIGTQMVGKGFNFPRLELVGVMNADVTLNLSDFRGAERTFQMVTQVAGRAGRGDRPGRVLVQTYSPDHYSLVAARDHDYIRFARLELERRERLCYPPFASLIDVIADSEDETAPARVLGALRASLIELAAAGAPVKVLGPVPARVPKIQGRHRWHILLKAPPDPAAFDPVRTLLRGWELPRGVTGRIQVDP